MAASILLLNPRRHRAPARKLTQSANRNPVENNMRREPRQQQKQGLNEGKTKNKPRLERPAHRKRPTRAQVGSWPAAMEAAGVSRHGKEKSVRPKRPITKLGLPDLDHCKSAVLDSLRSPKSKRRHRHAIDEFIQWYCSEPRPPFKVVVTRYRIFRENRQLADGDDQRTTRRCTTARLRGRRCWLT